MRRQYNNLTILSTELRPLKTPQRDKKNERWAECLCECGAVKWFRLAEIKRNPAKSCGCKWRAATAASNKNRSKHGKTGTPLFRVWKGMRGRCNNPTNAQFDDYGGRGIGVCSLWDEFAAFQEWALSNGYQRGLYIDRIDNDGDYSPENCRFVTNRESCRNKRNNIQVTWRGQTRTLIGWSEDEKCAVDYSTLRRRHHAGWEFEQAMLLPPGQKRPNAKRRLPTRKDRVVLTWCGETKTLMRWVEDPRCTISYAALWNRVKTGWSAERAITTPLRQRT